MARSPSPRRLRGLLLGAVSALVLGASGCGYTLRAPYDRTIRTVYVPVFRSFSFREDLNLKLTEEVIKEVERRTPYRVVSSREEADTILSGTVMYANKYVSVVNPNNLPRQIMNELTAEVTWEDVRGGVDLEKAPPTVRLSETVPSFVELGETATLAYDQAIKRMAVDIVNMMEEPW